MPSSTINTTKKPAMVDEALRLVGLGARLHPVDWPVPSPSGQGWESQRDAYGRRIAARDGEEFRPQANVGKMPLIKGWQTKASNDPAQVKRFWSKADGGYPRANIGVATGPGSGFWILDIDGLEGRASLDKLIAEHGPLPHTVQVETHSGGLHVWLKWPEGVDLRNTTSAIAPKIDVRADGGFGIAPPSRGASGNLYRYVEGCGPDDAPIAPAPVWLLNLALSAMKVNAEHASKLARRPGKPAQASALLAAESPTQAARGLEEHLERIGDAEGQGGFDGPIYRAACAYFARHGEEADAAPLKAKLRETIAAATVKPDRANFDLYLSDDYLDRRTAQACAFVAERRLEERARSFEQEGDLLVFRDEAAAIAHLNREWAVFRVNGRVRIGNTSGRTLELFTRSEASDWLANIVIRDRGKNRDEDRPVFDAWMRSSKRRQYERVVFDPTGKAGPKAYNTFRGFPLEPRPGNWRLLQEHAFDQICNGNLEHYGFLLAFLADIFQNPGVKPGVAVVLVGEKGVGKSVLSDVLAHMLGDLSVTVSSAEQLFSGFNVHTADKILLLGEEAIYSGDPKADSSLKHLITGRRSLVTRKGSDSEERNSYARLLLTSNSERAVPVTADERRYFVAKVGTGKQQDRPFFAALMKQMLEDGGAEAMLFDLMTFPVERYDLRNPPRTDALLSQAEASFRPIDRWFHEVLVDGCFRGRMDDGNAVDVAWEFDKPLTISAEAVIASYLTFVRGIRFASGTPGEAGKALRRFLPGMESSRPAAEIPGGPRPQLYHLPSLSEARACFTRLFHVTFGEKVQESKPVVRFADCPEAQTLASTGTTSTATIIAAGSAAEVPMPENDVDPKGEVA